MTIREPRASETAPLLHNLLLFGRVCRGLGLAVTATCIEDAARALTWTRLSRKTDVQSALRALFVTRQADLDTFDAAFRLFWRKPSRFGPGLDLRSLGEPSRRRETQFVPPSATESIDRPGRQDDSEPWVTLLPVYSSQEVLRRKDFGSMTPQEAAEVKRWISGMRFSLGLRKTRRSRRGHGAALDARRLLRHSLRFGGEVVELPSREPKFRPRRVVLLCDVSGSMERYTRLLLHFMHVLALRLTQIESFVFATRLTRITRALRRKSVDRALAEIGGQVRDWGGGTRIGEALHSFRYDYSRRVLGWGAVVLLISDGWDRGEPELLKREAAHLARACHRFIWLNPLLGGEGYQPLTRGAAALLPHVDDFLPVHNLASLEKLGKLLGGIAERRHARD